MRQIDTLEDIDALFSAGGTTSSVRQIDTIDDIDSLFGGPSRSTNYGPSAISGPFNPSYAPPEEPEYLRPVEPAYSYVSPATALQRQVDATAAARKMSQDYATLPKRVADAYRIYGNEDLAREALDTVDELKRYYGEFSEEIESMLEKGIKPELMTEEITKKAQRKRRQSELATQYPDFAKDVGKLFDQGFSADEVETQVGAMARSAYEQRQAKEALQYGKIAERGISLPPAQPVKEEGPSIGQQAAGLGAEVAIGATSQAAGAALAPATWGISYPVLSFAGGFTGSLAAQEIEGRDTISYGRAIRDGLLNLIPAGKGVKAATVGGKIAKTAVRGAVAGAPIGAAGAVIETGIEEQRLPTFEEITSQAAGGAVSGAVIGGAFAGFGEAFKSAYSKFAGKTTKQLDDAYRAGDPDAKLVVDTMKKVSRDAPDDVAPTSVINRAEDIEKRAEAEPVDLAPTPTREPVPVGPEPTPRQEPTPEPEPLPPTRPVGPITEFTSADDLRTKLQEKIAGATNKRQAIEEDARYYGVSTNGKTAQQVVDEIVTAATKAVEPEPVVRPPVAEEPPARQASEETIPGTRAIAQRIENARNKFVEFAMESAGLTREQAVKALESYKKSKAIKIDPIVGQFSFTHGGFAEADVLRRAAGLEDVVAPVARAEQPSAPAPRPAEPAPEPGKKARGFSSYKREGLTPIIDYINDEGGLLPRSKLRNKQGGEYDAAPSVSELGGFGRAVYGGSIPADEMATMLYNAGLIDDASPDLMFSKIRSEINSYRQNRARNADIEQQDKLASKQGKAFQRDAISKPKDKEPVNTASLNVGDEVKIGGESFKVREIDPDTNAVVLEDGEKYGVQIVEDGVTIYGKVEKKAPQAEGESPFGEELRLESQTPEQIAAERARSEQRAEIERRQAEPMRGKPLDTTADIFGEGETPLFNQRRAEASAPQPQRLEDLDLGNLRAEIEAIASYQGKQKRLNELAEQFGVPTGGAPREILVRIEEAYNAAKERQVAEGGVGEYRGDGARVQEEGQDRIITPEVQEGRPEAGGGYRPAPSGNVPPGPVGRGVQGEEVAPATPTAGATAPLPGGQKRFGFIGSTKQKKSVEIDESISPNVKAVDDALERQQRDLERLSMDKGRKSFDSIAEGLWDSQSLAKRKLIASELKDAESRLILRKGWAANAKDQYDERISAIDKLITHGNEKSFSEYLEMRRLVEVADLKSAKGEDYDLPYGITPEQAKEWISTFERQKSADGTLNTYKSAADEYYKAARQQLDEMRAEGLLTKEGYTSLVQNHKNYSPQQMIDKLDPENSSGLAKPGAGAPIKALKGGSESGRVIDYRYLLARTIAAAQNRIFTNRANKELVSGVQKGGEKVAKEIGAIIDDGSFDKIPSGYERIKSFDDGIEKSIFVPKEFAKSWNESDPGLNKATAEFLRTWSGSRVVKAMATGYNPEFIFSNFPRDAAYAWFRTGEYSPILPIGAVQQVKDYVDTAKDAFRKSGIYKDYLKEGGGLDGLSAEGRLDKNPWDKVTPTTQTAKDLARWASFLGEFSERWTRLAVYNRAIKNGKSKMEAAKIARDMLDFSQGGKLVKGVDTVVPYLNAMTQGTRGLANSFTENGLGKQSFKAAQVMAIAAGLGSVAREYFNEQWNAISDQEKASKWIIPLPGSYKDDEGKTRYRYLAIPKDQGQAVFAAMSDAMVGAMRGEKPDAKALLFALKQAVPDVTAGSPIGNAALAYFNNLDTFRMEEVYKGRPTTPSAEFSGNAALDESMRKLSEISGGAIEISPARLKRATEKIILPHNPFTIMTGLAANQLLPEELRAEANEFAIENQPFIRRFLRSTQPIEVPASVAEKAERLGLETGDKPGKQVRREVYQAERELGAKRNVQDKEIRKIMSGIKSGRTSYRDLLRYIDETPEEDRNRIRRRMNDIQEEYGLEFDFSGSDIGLPKLSELRGGLKTIK